jgi:hypothetical protein
MFTGAHERDLRWCIAINDRHGGGLSLLQGRQGMMISCGLLLHLERTPQRSLCD